MLLFFFTWDCSGMRQNIKPLSRLPCQISATLLLCFSKMSKSSSRNMLQSGMLQPILPEVLWGSLACSAASPIWSAGLESHPDPTRRWRLYLGPMAQEWLPCCYCCGWLYVQYSIYYTYEYKYVCMYVYIYISPSLTVPARTLTGPFSGLEHLNLRYSTSKRSKHGQWPTTIIDRNMLRCW